MAVEGRRLEPGFELGTGIGSVDRCSVPDSIGYSTEGNSVAIDSEPVVDSMVESIGAAAGAKAKLFSFQTLKEQTILWGGGGGAKKLLRS